MKLTKISVKGSSPWNEDALVINPSLNMYGVIDGATSLAPFKGEHGETGGYYAAQIISEYLQEMQSPSNKEWSPVEALLQANRELRAEMMKHGIQTDRKEELWGACAVLIRMGDNFIEYAQAGDCMLIAEYEDGTFRTVTHDQLAHVDNKTRAIWAEGIEAGLQSSEDLWAHVKPQIVSGRHTANTQEGYAVLNGDPDLSRYIESGKINYIKLKTLLLMSDGLYHAKPIGHEPANAEETARFVSSMGLEGYIQHLIQLEEGDPQCLHFPRVKKSDDKTAIWIDFT